MKTPGTASQIIGDTPILKLDRVGLGSAGQPKLFAKVEASNPGGSVKDRIARAMIDEAERVGALKPGQSTIIEATSGNTGIALAMLGAARGYRVILTMPESMSLERRLLLKAHGAELVLTPSAEGMNGAVKAAQRLHEEAPDSWIADQFENQAGPRAHYETTGPEIAAALGGKAPDYFVAGVGTGGTLSGTGRYLKDLNPDMLVIAVEPAESPIISQTLAGDAITPGPHGIQGIGPNFIPGTLDIELLDEAITVSTQEAILAARSIASEEGLLTGISSGANLAAALLIAERDDAAEKTIVTVFPDTGERYFSSPLWSDLSAD